MSVAGLDVAQANNFLALEPRIVALLSDAVAGMRPAVQVLNAAALADVKSGSQHAPALHVIYGGTRIEEEQGRRLLLMHSWHVVVLVRNVGSTRSGQHARQDAGPLLARVMSALAGATLEGATRPLALVTPPAPWHEAGVQHIPCTVEVQTVFHKTH